MSEAKECPNCDECRLLTVEDLALRWRVSVSRIRNAEARHLPPRVLLPGSRLIRFRLKDVIAWEARHVVPQPE